MRSRLAFRQIFAVGGLVPLLGFGTALLAPRVLAATLEDPVRNVVETVLPNGLRVFTLEDHATPVVSLQVWVGVGSSDESRYTGLAHLFEHMMFKGSKNVAPEEHAGLIEAKGGRVNAFTNRDATVYFEVVTTESLPLVIDLEAERFANLVITEETLAPERQVVLEERRMRVEENPSGLGFETLTALTWTANAYRWPVIGWPEDVQTVPAEMCREFFDAYYVPNNLVLIIVGDFDTETTLTQVRSTFGRLSPAQSIPRNPVRRPDQKGERRSVVEFEVQAPLLLVAWHAPAAGHLDADALDVLSQVLSAGRSSRLYRSLVYDAQVALYAKGGYWELREAGLFSVSIGVRPGVSVKRVEELLLGEIGALRAEGVEANEIEKAKRQLEAGFIESQTTNHALASRIGRDMFFFGRIRSIEERLESIRGVTVADVQRVAKDYLRSEKRTVVHVVSPTAREAGP